MPNITNCASVGFSRKKFTAVIKPTITAIATSRLMMLIASTLSLESEYDRGKKIAFIIKPIPIADENSKSTSTYL